VIIDVLFRFSFPGHYNSSSSFLKTKTSNSSSRFNFRKENYTAGKTESPAIEH